MADGKEDCSLQSEDANEISDKDMKCQDKQKKSSEWEMSLEYSDESDIDCNNSENDSIMDNASNIPDSLDTPNLNKEPVSPKQSSEETLPLSLVNNNSEENIEEPVLNYLSHPENNTCNDAEAMNKDKTNIEPVASFSIKEIKDRTNLKDSETSPQLTTAKMNDASELQHTEITQPTSSTVHPSCSLNTDNIDSVSNSSKEEPCDLTSIVEENVNDMSKNDSTDKMLEDDVDPEPIMDLTSSSIPEKQCTLAVDDEACNSKSDEPKENAISDVSLDLTTTKTLEQQAMNSSDITNSVNDTKLGEAGKDSILSNHVQLSATMTMNSCQKFEKPNLSLLSPDTNDKPVDYSQPDVGHSLKLPHKQFFNPFTDYFNAKVYGTNTCCSTDTQIDREQMGKRLNLIRLEPWDKVSTTNAVDTVPQPPISECIVEEISRTETGFPEVFKDLVTIGKFISVKGDFTLKSTEALIESPSLMAPFLLKEPDIFPQREEEKSHENKGYFNSSVGELLMSLGQSFVTEWFQHDIIRLKTRQIKRSGRTEAIMEELKNNQECYSQAKKANEPFKFPLKTCKICNYETESDVILEGHLLEPHSTLRREYQCSFCTYLNRDPKEILAHMAIAHSKIGHVKRPPFLHQCPYCTFESNSKMKYNSHLAKCMKYFDLGINQAPPRDFDFPCLTPKPITVAVVKAYEKSLNTMQRGRGRPRKLDSVPDSFQHHLDQFSNKKAVESEPMLQRHLSNIPLHSPDQMFPYATGSHVAGAMLGFNDQSINKRLMPYPSTNEHLKNATHNRNMYPSPQEFPIQMSKNKKQTTLTSMISPSNNLQSLGMSKQPLTTTPHLGGLPKPPKLQGPYPVQLGKLPQSVSNDLIARSLVVCEICDGYIKDLEQLRTHMQLIHKVKIHPKMLVSRPPLNCQKCQARFFTDQGLERHLLGTHGLVTSNMQELANINKDAGCCTICGRVYASRLVSHMSQVHKTNLKPAHLSYKCTVCSATFNLYRLFENHVYLVHSGNKRGAAGNSSSVPSKKIKTNDGVNSTETENGSK